MAKRERNPTYVVFESRQFDIEPDEPVTGWVEIATDVEAKTPRDAIAKATADRPVDDRAGTFWAPLASAFRPRSREVAVLHEDRWT